MGLALSEAMACGMPVITTKNAEWIVKNNYNGIVINENNIYEIVEKIIYLIENDDIRETLGRNAAIDSKTYTWDEYFDKFKKYLLDEVINE